MGIITYGAEWLLLRLDMSNTVTSVTLHSICDVTRMCVDGCVTNLVHKTFKYTPSPPLIGTGRDFLVEKFQSDDVTLSIYRMRLAEAAGYGEWSDCGLTDQRIFVSDAVWVERAPVPCQAQCTGPVRRQTRRYELHWWMVLQLLQGPIPAGTVL